MELQNIIKCLQATNQMRIEYIQKKQRRLKGWFATPQKFLLQLEIYRYSRISLRLNVPQEHTLISLWHHVNPNDWLQYHDDRITLLNQWLDFLYGEGTAIKLEVKERCLIKRSNHVQANFDWHAGKEDAAHFHFVDPFLTILLQVSDEMKNINTH